MYVLRLACVGVMMFLSGSCIAAEELPLNVGEWRSAEKLLGEAKKLIIEKGWQQGSTTPIERECASTALENAWKKLNLSLVDFQYAQDALNEAIGTPKQPLTAPGDPLSVPYWGRNFVYWNDMPGQTEAEVLAGFDRAIEIAKRNEVAAVAANVSGDVLVAFDEQGIATLKQKLHPGQ